MTVNASGIFIGLPDQLTTGAILTAPVGTTLPTSAVDTLNVAFKDSGYVTEDGVSVSPTWNTNKLHDWSGANVRTMLDSFEGQISFALMELLSEESAKQVFGASNVTKTAASSSHGTQLNISIGNTLPEERAWVFKMKDGNAKALIVIPRGQVSAVDTIAFNRNNSANLPVTLDCLQDSSGKSIYIMTDDGVMSA